MKKILAFLWIFNTLPLITFCQEIEIDGTATVKLEEEYREKKISELKDVINIKNGKYGYYDYSGSLVIPHKYDSIIQSTITYEDKQLIKRNFIVTKNQRYGVVDLNNQIILPFKYQFIKHVGEGNFLVMRKNKMGLISYKKEILIELKHDNLQYSGVNDLFFVTKNKFIGVIDKTGKNVIDPIYKKIIKYFHWAFKVIDKNEKVGLISLNNEMIVPVKYENIEAKSSKFILVKDSLYGAYSLQNGKILPAIYNRIKLLGKRLDFNAIVTKDNENSLVNDKGDIITKKKYDELERCERQFLCTEKNGKKGLLNSKGEQILDNLYADIIPVAFVITEHHRIFVKKDKLFALFDKKGNQLTPYSFKTMDYIGSEDYFAVTQEKSDKVGLLKIDGSMEKGFIFDIIDRSQGEIFGIIKGKKIRLGAYY